MAGTEAPKKRRLFVGTFLSAEDQRRLSALHQYDQELKSAWQAKLRWTAPEKLHLTWLFLGHVAEADIPAIQVLLAQVVARHRQLALSFDRFEFWPSAKRARLLVLTPQVVPGAVHELAGDTRHNLLQFVQHPEERAYRPHVTISRLEASERQALTIPENWSRDFLPVDQTIQAVDLIESRPGSGANTYVSLQSWSLNN